MDSGQHGNPQLIKVQRESVKCLAIERTRVSYLTPLPRRLDAHEEKMENILRCQVQKGLDWNRVFWT